jgi:hypothetical protein
MDFAQLLKNIESIKSDSFDIKIPTGALAHLLMSGAMDELLDSNPTVEQRFELINQIKKSANSEAGFTNSKQPKLDINNIKNEFQRLLWLKHINPIYTFKMYEYYSGAINSMMTYRPAEKESAKKAGIVYIKEPLRGHQVWIFKSWAACTQSAVLDVIMKINNDPHQKQKVAVGFVSLMDSFTTKKNPNFGEMGEVVFDDGQGYFTGVVWSDRVSQKIPLPMLTTIKSNIGKPCIVIGKIAKKSHFTSFSIWDIQELLV